MPARAFFLNAYAPILFVVVLLLSASLSAQNIVTTQLKW